jgi:hypothetical protein
MRPFHYVLPALASRCGWRIPENSPLKTLKSINLQTLKLQYFTLHIPPHPTKSQYKKSHHQPTKLEHTQPRAEPAQGFKFLNLAPQLEDGRRLLLIYYGSP